VTRFISEFAQLRGNIDALSVGTLLSYLLLEHDPNLPAQEAAQALITGLGKLDRQLAEAGASEELRSVLAGVHDAILNWFAIGPGSPVRAHDSESPSARDCGNLTPGHDANHGT
jgi:hypothetical protein